MKIYSIIRLELDFSYNDGSSHIYGAYTNKADAETALRDILYNEYEDCSVDGDYETDEEYDELFEKFINDGYQDGEKTCWIQQDCEVYREYRIHEVELVTD